MYRESEKNSNRPVGGVLLLKQTQVAKMMQISERQVFELRRVGHLVTTKVGKAIRFRIEDVNACIDKLRGKCKD